MTESFNPGDTVRVSKEVKVKNASNYGRTDWFEDEDHVTWRVGRGWTFELVHKALEPHDFANDPNGTIYHNRKNQQERWIKLPSVADNWLVRRIDQAGWFDENTVREHAELTPESDMYNPDNAPVGSAWRDNEGDLWWVVEFDGGKRWMCTASYADACRCVSDWDYNAVPQRYHPLVRVN